MNYPPGILPLLLVALNTAAGLDLAGRFAHQPPCARPWVFWFWTNGNITRNGITADLEAMQKTGKPDGSLAEWPKWLQQNDSSPTGRFTFSNFRLWQPDTPLEDSGLLGPVRLHSVTQQVISKRERNHRK